MDFDRIRAATMLFAALTPPAVALFRHAGRGLRLTERFLLGLALAPFALALPALGLALLAKIQVAACLLPSEFIWTVVALWPRHASAAVTTATEPLPERGQGFPSIAAIATALGAALLIAGVALSVPFVRMSGDAWLHAAAVVEVALRGVPPQDPNFAGVAFTHPWFFHFLLALLGGVSAAPPFEKMALVNAWAAVVLVLAAAQLTYRAFGRAAAMWVGAIVVLGLDPFGWAFVILRAVARETTGLANTIAELGTGSGAMTMLSYRFPPAHSSLLNRFWTGGALTPAIALGVATAWSVARALERPSRSASLRTLALALASLAFHPAYAAITLAILGAGILWLALRGERRGAGIALLAVLALAFAAAIPYLRACSVPGALTAVKLGFYPRNLWSLLLAVGPWWLIAAPAFGAARGGGVARRFCAAGALVAVIGALVIVLPQANSDKLFYLAWVSLAPMVAAGWVWWGDRLRLPAVARLTLVAALIVPTSGLLTLGTAIDPSSPGRLIRGEAAATRQLPLATEGEEEAYRYIREDLPGDAVVIEKPRPTVNEPVPVMGARPVFCGSLDVHLASQSGDGRVESPALTALREEFLVRRGIQDALFESGELDATQRQYLAGFSAPLYLLVRRSELLDAVWFGFMARPAWSEAFANHEMRLYRFDP